MKITRKISLGLLLLTTFVFSCKKKDDDKKQEEVKPAYEFKNQNASGKIDNIAWGFKSGDYTVTDGKIRIELAEVNDICTEDKENTVFLYVPMQTGVQKFSMSQTATLFKRDGFLNIIATEGAIEFTRIDTANGVVTGRIDAQYNEKSFVNGNFSLKDCKK